MKLTKVSTISLITLLTIISNSCGGDVVPYSAVNTNNTSTINGNNSNIEPKIESISKDSGQVGELITLTGQNLDLSKYSNARLIINTEDGNELNVRVLKSESNSLEFYVPFSSVTKDGKLKIIINGKESNKKDFAVRVPLPTQEQTELTNNFKELVSSTNKDDSVFTASKIQETFQKMLDTSKNNIEFNNKINQAIYNTINSKEDLDKLVNSIKSLSGYITEPLKESGFKTNAVGECNKSDSADAKKFSTTTLIYVNGINTEFGLDENLIKEINNKINGKKISSSSGSVTDKNQISQIESEMKLLKELNVCFSYSGFISNIVSLTRKINKEPILNKKIKDNKLEVIGIYNQTDGMETDLIEAAFQKVNNNTKVNCPSLTVSLLSNPLVSSVSCNILDNTQEKIQENISIVTNSIIRTIENKIISGNNVILIPHSQGNLFTNLSLKEFNKYNSLNIKNEFSTIENSDQIIIKNNIKSSIGIIGLGSPQKIYCDSDYNCKTSNDNNSYNFLKKDNIKYVSNLTDIVSWLGGVDKNKVKSLYNINNYSKEEKLSLSNYKYYEDNIEPIYNNCISNPFTFELLTKNCEKDKLNKLEKMFLTDQDYEKYLSIAHNKILKNLNSFLNFKIDNLNAFDDYKDNDIVINYYLNEIGFPLSPQFLILADIDNKIHSLDLIYSRLVGGSNNYLGLFHYHPLETGYLGEENKEVPALPVIYDTIKKLETNMIQDDEKQSKEEEQINLKQGVIQATLRWDGTGDIDLHTIEPSGKNVFWRSKVGNSGALDRDEVKALGPENYYVNTKTCLETGKYKFLVNYYGGTRAEVNFTLRIHRPYLPDKTYSGKLYSTQKGVQQTAINLIVSDNKKVVIEKTSDSILTELSSENVTK